MPIYIFKNTKTNETYEEFLSMSEREQYLKDNPEVIQVPTVPNIVGGVGGIKTDDGFNEVLSKISEAHPTSTLAQRHKRRTGKEVKTQQAINKHRKRIKHATTRSRV
tara:strand:- start:107 stop:427 length:321 start_codon:yes stop_codon:yes gene_type:complete